MSNSNEVSAEAIRKKTYKHEGNEIEEAMLNDEEIAGIINSFETVYEVAAICVKVRQAQLDHDNRTIKGE